jgi:glycosyltransferase involved in cell wall biosynthesis
MPKSKNKSKPSHSASKPPPKQKPNSNTTSTTTAATVIDISPPKVTPLVPTKEELKRPFVSVLCVTFNRRPFIPMFLEMVKNQTYPQSRIEIIIVDDGTDPIGDLIEKAGMPNVRYIRVKEKMPLGKKRNYANSLIDNRTKYIIPMDDDDVQMSERIEHSVEVLEKNPQALCAGSSEMFLFFKHIKKLYKFGPYMISPEDKARHESIHQFTNRIGGNINDYVPIPTQHATNGTFAYRRELINITRYNEKACLAEEKEYLKGYTIPMVQLNPFKCILCISHEHNTFDKRKLLENLNPMFVAESSRDVNIFFKLPKEQHIKDFFMTGVDKLLEKYDAGLQKHKPDVIKQIGEIEKEREELMRQQQQQMGGGMGGQPAIVINQPGQPPQQLTMEQVVQLIQSQQSQIDYLMRQVGEYEAIVGKYQRSVMETMLSDYTPPIAITESIPEPNQESNPETNQESNPETNQETNQEFTRIEIEI